MSEKLVYMVHKGTKGVITYNRKQALDFAKKNYASVRSIPWGLWRDVGYSMDMPTFIAQSDVVASFSANPGKDPYRWGFFKTKREARLSMSGITPELRKRHRIITATMWYNGKQWVGYMTQLKAGKHYDST